jgi:MscS family membrane protein
LEGGEVDMTYRRITIAHFATITMCFVMAAFFTVSSAMAQSALQKAAKETSKEKEVTEKAEPKKAPPAGPVDEYDRGVPQSSVNGFFSAVRDGKFERAANYLDLRNLPKWMDRWEGQQLARQFKIVLERALWIDVELVSGDPKGNTEDGLPPYRESVGRIKTPTRTVDILLQRVPRKDGVYIWKFSNRTVAEIPSLYQHFGYRPLEERLSRLFPDFTLLGWQSWQWAGFLVLIGLGYLAALLPTWFVGLLLHHRDTEKSQRVAQFVTSPLRIILWLVFLQVGVHIIGPSATVHLLQRAGTLLTIALAWATIRVMDLVFDWWSERLRETGQKTATTLLRPVKTISKIIIVLLAVLVWLGNIGYDVTTLLAGLGVGGIAIALAAQDTLKNFFGSVMIFLDKPYQVGQRIVAQGHDGFVEEIGLRSTRLRLLTGHQANIPNETMARVGIENIGRRPHIRRRSNIQIAYDTPLEKVEKAVKIIEEILKDHEGMAADKPPRVYFNEFNDASLNIMMIYWYQPPDYWAFQDFNQKVNVQIMQEFEKEGIEFAFPTTTTYLAHDDRRPLRISVAGDFQMPEKTKA